MAYKIKNTQKDTMQSANYYATTPEDKRIDKEMKEADYFAEDEGDKEIDNDETFLEEDEDWGIDE